MRITSSWRLVKLLIISAVLTLSAHILLSRVIPKKNITRPSPISQEHYKVISPATYKYVLNQPSVCKDRRSPFLVFMVPVVPGDSTSRNAIRKTWGTPGVFPGVDIITLFYVGFSEGGRDSPIQADLEKESTEHADVIQMDFLDSYHNLTIKTLMIMNWLATHCQSASYAMKVDADIFVNVFYLVNMLGSSPKQDFITGSVIWDGRPRRDRKSKWYLSEELYSEDHFPPYVSGAGYVFSVDLAKRISWASRFVRMVPLEDVYVGLCLQVIGVTPVYSQSLLFLRNLFEVGRLPYDRCTYAKRVIVNGFKPSELLDIWQDFLHGHLSC